ncbi:MAG: nucleotidyltransferase domain-containing protein [Planctomycetes bacterium]|nr:nucleotidyltransferase domain-containing protein [Planctomycetota bacterium]
MDSKQAVTQDVLDEIVRRIVAAVRPLRIILFGSAARGQTGADSDLDLLIVVRDGCHTRQVAQHLYSQLRGIGCAKDLVVVQESDVRKHGDNPYLIIHDALRDGKELYRAVE